jgi:hypothetical protein
VESLGSDSGLNAIFCFGKAIAAPLLLTAVLEPEELNVLNDRFLLLRRETFTHQCGMNGAGLIRRSPSRLTAVLKVARSAHQILVGHLVIGCEGLKLVGRWALRVTALKLGEVGIRDVGQDLVKAHGILGVLGVM